MRTLFLAILLYSFAIANAQPFVAAEQPPAPDYSLAKNWSALPFRQDAADFIPKAEEWVNDSLKEVDVFYVYPTMYKNGKQWNADVNDKALNKSIDGKPVKYQASVFNQSCRVYVPRYRQSDVKAFYQLDQEGAKSLAFAYDDVKRAFEYYLKHYNAGRPFILASHSQGTHHARRLLQEMIDTTTLRNRMVAAYVIGFGIDTAMYKVLQPCLEEKQTGCYITWASFKKGAIPEMTSLYGNICINPLTWKATNEKADKICSKGAILLDFNKKYEKEICTEVHDGYLWVENKLPIVSGMENLHIADYNLFWYDIRENVKTRIAAFWKK
ncbi:MAG: DUF3089 domain-containing protein [Bacteroidetes bacterium]|nr:DUF3089 domain-containing protein [Bacteroidota bacterium]